MLLAYTYPVLSIFFSMLMFFGLVLMVFFIVWCFIDNFRRRDHSAGAKVLWTILIIFLPVLGALFYVIARPADAGLLGRGT